MSIERVPSFISDDVVIALKSLLDGARHGDITGVAFAASLRGRRYITNVTGSCLHYPTHTRGMVATLADELSTLIRQIDPEDTR